VLKEHRVQAMPHKKKRGGKLVMRKVVIAGLGIALCSAAFAQSYPTRPIRLIVPYPPGGATDIIARGVADKVGHTIGQQVVVDNRGGGAQIIGTDLVAKAAPNGYTILLASVTHSINPGLQPKLPYDSIRDFAPITLMASGANVLVVHPSVAARSTKELIALAKSRPGQLNYASSGNGSGGHLAAELFKTMTDTDMTHVPYKGGGPAYVDLVAGQVNLMFTSPVPTLPHVKAGKLRALATTGAGRSPAMPDLPTIAETGLAGYEASLWYGILSPAGMPAPVVSLLHKHIVAALRQPEMKERFGPLGVEIATSTPEEFLQHIQRETAKWTKVIKAADIKPD
jgi:tripartite-type tricarboxylate transporter receptor subunit TctC